MDDWITTRTGVRTDGLFLKTKILNSFIVKMGEENT
jgi:hypothetical protein